MHHRAAAQVAGETEVKAQIKLRFRTATGAPVVVCRSFQLSQKKAALQFKTLDSVLQTYNKDTGAKQAITYRQGAGCRARDACARGARQNTRDTLENKGQWHGCIPCALPTVPQMV
jgi:hypothetical protein